MPVRVATCCTALQRAARCSMRGCVASCCAETTCNRGLAGALGAVHTVPRPQLGREAAGYSRHAKTRQANRSRRRVCAECRTAGGSGVCCVLRAACYTSDPPRALRAEGVVWAWGSRVWNAFGMRYGVPIVCWADGHESTNRSSLQVSYTMQCAVQHATRHVALPRAARFLRCAREARGYALLPAQTAVRLCSGLASPRRPGNELDSDALSLYAARSGCSAPAGAKSASRTALAVCRVRQDAGTGSSSPLKSPRSSPSPRRREAHTQANNLLRSHTGTGTLQARFTA
jgi:hypothetical protein